MQFLQRICAVEAFDSQVMNCFNKFHTSLALKKPNIVENCRLAGNMVIMVNHMGDIIPAASKGVNRAQLPSYRLGELRVLLVEGQVNQFRNKVSLRPIGLDAEEHGLSDVPIQAAQCLENAEYSQREGVPCYC